MISRFRVWENQGTNLGEFDDKDEAIKIAQDQHRKHMDRWHEIYRFDDGNMAGHGIAQWQPEDCPECHSRCIIVEKDDGTKVYLCYYCEPQIPYRQTCHFRITGYCDECGRAITDTIAFKTKQEECDSIHASNLRAREMLARTQGVGPI